MTEKECSRCGEVKPLDEYSTNNKSKDRLEYSCRVCRRQIVKKCQSANPEKVREYQRQWRAANPEKVREKSRRYREENPDKVRESDKRWRDANQEKIREKNREKCKMWRRKKKIAAAKRSKKHTYLVTDGEFVKIGAFTAGKLETRLLGLQTGNPRKLKVLATSASNIEKLCHYEFEDLNVLNEWFKLDLRIIHFFTEHAK